MAVMEAVACTCPCPKAAKQDLAFCALQVEWHEDLKKVLKMAGEANKRVVFLFADTQIKSESFVEDISNLLNTYEVPNLLQPADLATTFENIRPRAKAAGLDGNKDQLYTFFLQEVPPLALSITCTDPFCCYARGASLMLADE